MDALREYNAKKGVDLGVITATAATVAPSQPRRLSPCTAIPWLGALRRRRARRLQHALPSVFVQCAARRCSFSDFDPSHPPLYASVQPREHCIVAHCCFSCASDARVCQAERRKTSADRRAAVCGKSVDMHGPHYSHHDRSRARLPKETEE